MPDDDELNNLPIQTLMWMATMIAKDEEDAFDRDLSFVEYLATFINPDAVGTVQEKRKKPGFDMEESRFLDLLQKVSGREAPELKRE